MAPRPPVLQGDRTSEPAIRIYVSTAVSGTAFARALIALVLGHDAAQRATTSAASYPSVAAQNRSSAIPVRRADDALHPPRRRQRQLLRPAPGQHRLRLPIRRRCVG
jgi:hypothetical protein